MLLYTLALAAMSVQLQSPLVTSCKILEVRTPTFIRKGKKMSVYSQTCVMAVLALLSVCGGQQSPATCKNPTVVERLMADDVRVASPFYVIALPRTSRTEQIDNVCYTYFESGNNNFAHVISVVYKNRTNVYYPFIKADIERMGLARAAAVDKKTPCEFIDYTLTPVCNSTVFILYRCFTQGSCQNADIGVTAGVDVRLVLAAVTQLSAECLQEVRSALQDTSSLEGGDYVILPQKSDPQCITRLNNNASVNAEKALGSRTVVEEDLNQRFGDNSLTEHQGQKVMEKPTYPPKGRPSSLMYPGSSTQRPYNRPYPLHHMRLPGHNSFHHMHEGHPCHTC